MRSPACGSVNAPNDGCEKTKDSGIPSESEVTGTREPPINRHTATPIYRSEVEFNGPS